MAYTFNVKMGTQNYTIEIDTKSKYGYFEHNEIGDESAGGLWFDEQMQLVDYDGTFYLPTEVLNILIMFHMIDPANVADYT